jgi:hypothetical protein
MNAPHPRPSMPSVHDRVAAKFPRREEPFDDAPCVGKWFIVDLPTDLRLSKRSAVIEHFAHALSLCASCPLTQACLERVAPRQSYYDGVAGGLVFRNGECIGGLSGVIPSARRAS